MFLYFLLFLVVLFAVLFGLEFLATPFRYGHRLEFNKGELYYQEPVTEAEARRLGEYLVQSGYFAGREITVQLRRQQNTYQVRMVVQKQFMNDPNYRRTFTDFGRQIGQNVFPGQRIELHLCDEQLQTVQVISP